ncbi:MAG TPA: hypothetical protein VGE59_04945 [Patescibacteria group bacterium]
MFENKSLSYFGTCLDTLLPYALSLLVFAGFIHRAIGHMPRAKPFVQTARILRILSLFMVGLVVTPYSVGPEIKLAHTIVAMVASDIMLGLTFWLALFVRRDRVSVSLLITQVTAGILAGLALLDKGGLFLAGEMVYVLAFGAILARTIHLTHPAP